MMTAFFASRTVHAVTGPEVNQIQKERRILPSTGNTLHFQNTHTIILSSLHPVVTTFPSYNRPCSHCSIVPAWEPCQGD